VYESPNLPNIKNFNLGGVLSDGLGVRVWVENDATAAAWGEYLFGGHDGIEDMLVVTLGTGIGGGLVLRGKLYRGARGFAGEIGHVPLYVDGPECECGGKGCLELYTGKFALERDYLARSGLSEPVEPKIIFERAISGDLSAQETFKTYGKHLGLAFAHVANLLDLGAVVLTGGILGAWDFFYKSLFETFNLYLITPLKNRVPIKKSSLGGKSGILGAAFLDKAGEEH